MQEPKRGASATLHASIFHNSPEDILLDLKDHGWEAGDAPRRFNESAAELATLFAEEREGWKGYIEWERYPEKKRKAAEILSRYNFKGNDEFQLVPLPSTNPILEGKRWKQYHKALAGTIQDIPAISWKYVTKEKSDDMIHVLQFPYNGEPPRDRLVQTEFTPNEDHFVRNHGGIPEIEPEKYFVEVDGLVKEPQSLSFADIQDETKFPHKSLVVTLQCSGTRRIEQIHEYPGDGDELINAPWGEGAIGNARYTGVSLKKIIKHCGGLVDGADNIEFYGCDTYFKKGQVYNYVVSVPWRKVKANEVLLAWDMNGKPLPKIHGYPLRVVVCGYIGARSCKWLYRIKGIRGPSMAPVQMKEYLYYTPQVGKQNAMYSNGFSIQDMPVSSAIMSPIDKKVIVHSGSISLRGWAYSGGGHWPIRVEVSGDGGSIWYEVPPANLSTKYYHGWRLWSIDLPVDAEGWLELCVRCWDNALNTQPTFVRSAWNWDLHVTSSCHRIKVYSVNKSRKRTSERLAKLEEQGLGIEPLTMPLEVDLESEEDYIQQVISTGGRDPVE
ncbi:molybdopterin binding oxidoreductase [Pseudovirgaria hyperparasitica]|uniref:Molybdopterin binding oxidoreductase n=1 Tax=Pseudovirgaria hyperparasitica TaxID=470096 RepID=A0A6A6WA58_9PEZI|nr:molybdopterin binding oxidoreductase [Pseudovirgaria hyperparasitica]KAF2758914.1 molybdopterin binding oxidoreductase [Pseudovirgaria hyperparasitica]